MKRGLLTLIPFLSLLQPVSFGAEEFFAGKGVRVRLLCEASTIASGDSFVVALELSHEAGFHTYWQNPGTVGVPTQVTWELPEGFQAGQLVWQPPERSKMFEYDVYGYEKNATLLTEIRSPAKLDAEPILLRAKVSWMACNDSSCNPGYHTFELRLPVGKRTVWNPKVKQLVRDAKARIPTPLPSLLTSAEAEGREVRLRIEGKIFESLQDAPGLHFFSTLNHYKIDARQKTRIKRGALLITLTKTDYAPDKIDQVEGILRLPANGLERGKHTNVLIKAKLE
ncbi:MAG: protein-disulfide reductase DsbD domain-containing protein [Opitutales bacterium]